MWQIRKEQAEREQEALIRMHKDGSVYEIALQMNQQAPS